MVRDLLRMELAWEEAGLDVAMGGFRQSGRKSFKLMYAYEKETWIIFHEKINRSVKLTTFTFTSVWPRSVQYLNSTLHL